MKRTTAQDSLLFLIRNTALKLGQNPDDYYVLRASDNPKSKEYRRFWVCHSNPDAKRLFGTWSRSLPEWRVYIDGLKNGYYQLIHPTAQGE